jgi:Uma2 family endonuclease
MNTLLQEMAYSADDLLALSRSPEYIHMRLELSEGRLIVMSPASWKHGGYTSLLLRLVGNFVDEHDLGMTTGAETGYILFKSPDPDLRDTVRAPDVGFIAKHRLPDELPERGYVPFAPDLAIEVISPNDDAEDIHRKVAEYLKSGTRLIWLFYPNAETVGVYNGQRFQSLERGDTLDGGDVLPGFRLPLTEIFKRS